MAGQIKGMTIEIGGNTAPLEQALKGVNKEINATQKELNSVNKLLKLDPNNVTLLKQKQELLTDAIGKTTTKLDALKQAQKKLDDEVAKGNPVNQAEYRKLEREIESTKITLSQLNEEAKQTHPRFEKVKEVLSNVGNVAGGVLKAGLDLTIEGIKVMATACTTAVTSVGALAVKAGQLADDLNTLSKTTGLSTEQLQKFQYASELIDVDMNTLTGALKKTTTAMASAQTGSGKYAEAFKKLGVSVTDANGNLRDNNDVFEESIRALGKVANETERDALAMELFGKSATELNPLIEGGIDDLQMMGQKAEELGLILSQEALDGANAFNDQLDILKANGQKTFQVIGTEIANQLTPAMEELNTYTEEIIKSLTSALNTGGLSGLATELSKQLGKVLSDITKKLPEIADFGVKLVKGLVESIKENASEIGKAGAELVTVLVEGFWEILPTVIETAIQLVTAFIETIAEKLPEILPKIVDGVIAIAEAIVDNLDLIIEAGIQLFLGLVEGLVQALPKLIAKIPEIVEKVCTTLIEHIDEIIEAVTTIFVTVIEAIVENISTLLPAIVECVIAVAMCLIEHIDEIIDAVIEIILAVTEAMIDNIDVLLEATFKIIVALAEGLIEATPKLIEKIPIIIEKICTKLAELMFKLVEKGAEIITSIWEGIKEKFEWLGQKIGEICSSIWDWFTDGLKNIADVGKHIVEGIWQGIENMKNWLYEKLFWWCEDLVKAMQGDMEISSPSRVMADKVGKFMAQGVGMGFEKTLPSVIDGMTDSLAGITDAFRTELNFADIPQIQGHTIHTENSYVTKNYTNTIETIRQPQAIDLVLDGTKVARALIPAFDNEYNRLGVKV